MRPVTAAVLGAVAVLVFFGVLSFGCDWRDTNQVELEQVEAEE